LEKDITEENIITSRIFKRRNINKQDELQLYLSLSPVDADIDPLKW
jgi:hypothetical protein